MSIAQAVFFIEHKQTNRHKLIVTDTTDNPTHAMANNILEGMGVCI